MTWRVATSLETVLGEINAGAPNRSKASDGSIGDPAHSARESDHNPNEADVVRARDFTHDPANGFDCNDFAPRVAALLGVHPALGSGAYVIWNRRIISTDRRYEGWRYYGDWSTGLNPHDKHAHVSVQTPAPGYDSTAPWLTLEDDMADYAAQLDAIQKQNDTILKRLDADAALRGRLKALVKQGKANARELAELQDTLEGHSRG